MRRLFADANYDFINRRRLAYTISGIALAVGIAAAIFWQIGSGSWLNYGVDFTGGTLVRVTVTAPDVSTASTRAVVETVAPGAQVTTFGGETGNFMIRTPGAQDEAAAETANRIRDALVAEYGEDAVTINMSEGISARVGSELQVRALIAILISFAATLVYLAFRFEWRFGVAAVIATVHDVVFTLGFLALLRIEVSLTTVAAVLTIVGYSLNDTIVVFDRIRENLRTARRHEFVQVLNRSINETLPRTVLTSATTVVTLLALYMLGGLIIRDFALVLIVGIVLGTYSSIFIASPALYEIERRWPHEPKKVRTRTARSRPGVA